MVEATGMDYTIHIKDKMPKQKFDHLILLEEMTVTELFSQMVEEYIKSHSYSATFKQIAEHRQREESSAHKG